METKKLFKVLIISLLLSISLSYSEAQSSVKSTQYIDLTEAAEQSVHAVVHIKTEFLRKNSAFDDFFGGSFWEEFFGTPNKSQYPVMAAGSGVIISSDGYIVTNNHVVEDANKVTITLNDKREFEAEIVGTDPETDLALVKIDAEGLPFLTFGNSDRVKIGEWVLAVGNPFNLTSTVTAGIVSAKARNLNILADNSSIESFIQTDAAVNQGNSGGALVNASGELIGINSAIASGNGYYTGYSFAIPSNIAQKVTNDLKQYQRVQRAYLGIALMEVDAQKAKELQLNEIKGLYVAELSANGAASINGLQEGDIILKINNVSINTMSELREILAQYSPGDKVSILYMRNNLTQNTEVTLLNSKGNTDIINNEELNPSTILGAEFSNISDKEKKYLDIDGGVKVTSLYDGILFNAGVKKGFIITSVNEYAVNDLDDFYSIISNYKNNFIVLVGVYNNGYYRYSYTIQLP